MAHGIPQSFVNQAAYVSKAKYQPELDALKYISQAARLSRDQNIQNARSSANYLTRAAAQAQGPLLAGYQRILGNREAAMHQFSQDMGHIASAGDQPSGAMKDEAHIAADNLGLTAQAALSILAQTQTRAQAEGNYQVKAAQGTFDQANRQVAQRRQDILGQRGGDFANQLSGLLDTQRKQNFTAGQNKARNRVSLQKTKITQAGDNQRSAASIAGQNQRSAASIQAQNQRSAASIQAANQRAANHAGGGGGVNNKPLTRSQQNKVIDQIGEAQTWIQRLSQSPHITSTMIRGILQGGSTIDVGGQKVKVPKFGHTVINSAYDLHVFQGLSPANVTALRRAGVRPMGRLPFETPVRRAKPQHGMVP